MPLGALTNERVVDDVTSHQCAVVAFIEEETAWRRDAGHVRLAKVVQFQVAAIGVPQFAVRITAGAALGPTQQRQ